MDTLAKYLVTRPLVRHLNLASNNISAEGVESLLTLLPFLKTLDLSNVPGFANRNTINGATCGALLRALCANPGLHSLNLSNNALASTPTPSSSASASDPAPITHTTVLELLSALLSRYQTNLTYLTLDRNALGSRGATTILGALAQNKSLRFLSLSVNDITADIAQTLDILFRVNTSLCGLDLRGNPLGPGVSRFCQALSQNKHITSLDLENCGIDDTGALALAQVLAVNRSITRLNLSHNNIGSKGGFALATALKYNNVLDTLNLAGNPLRPQVGSAVADALKHNMVRIDVYYECVLFSNISCLVDLIYS
jgi:Ran GTPase-activating protein (RanGAP) involved in mRNA processing and transport